MCYAAPGVDAPAIKRPGADVAIIRRFQASPDTGNATAMVRSRYRRAAAPVQRNRAAVAYVRVRLFRASCANQRYAKCAYAHAEMQVANEARKE